MEGPCIAIDVSKDESHIQGYMTLGEPIGDAAAIGHDKEGFERLDELGKELTMRVGRPPAAVFEATGIYHRGLQSHLESIKMTYYIVNPLLAAKCRKQELRTKKTDVRDCKNLAKVYYTTELRATTTADENYYRMRQLSRYYEDLLNHLRKCKVGFTEALDVVHPGYRDVFDDPYTATSFALLKVYPHPSTLERRKPETVARILEKQGDHGVVWCFEKAEQAIRHAQSCVSGCKATDVNVDILLGELEQVEAYQKRTAEILNQIVEQAKTLPEFHLLTSVPGIGENLAARIMAEVGDIKRFARSKQLAAYAGLDPIVYQSGQMDGLHLRISKKGNKRLRCLVYLAARCGLAQRTTNVIKDFYNKKTRQAHPLCAKAASVACAHKLLRIIHGMCVTGTQFR